MKRSVDMITIVQEEKAPEACFIKVIMLHSHGDDENGSKGYIVISCKSMNNNVVLSAIARTSSSNMKTDVFMREPVTITIIMKLFSTSPVPFKS